VLLNDCGCSFYCGRSNLAATPYDPAHDTVDTVKTGDPHQPVRGIITTFLASYEVIEQAIVKGANFIIVHEPPFYNHLDEEEYMTLSKTL
jgi:hypothetical protein